MPIKPKSEQTPVELLESLFEYRAVDNEITFRSDDGGGTVTAVMEIDGTPFEMPLPAVDDSDSARRAIACIVQALEERAAAERSEKAVDDCLDLRESVLMEGLTVGTFREPEIIAEKLSIEVASELGSRFLDGFIVTSFTPMKGLPVVSVVAMDGVYGARGVVSVGNTISGADAARKVLVSLLYDINSRLAVEIPAWGITASAEVNAAMSRIKARILPHLEGITDGDAFDKSDTETFINGLVAHDLRRIPNILVSTALMDDEKNLVVYLLEGDSKGSQCFILFQKPISDLLSPDNYVNGPDVSDLVLTGIMERLTRDVVPTWVPTVSPELAQELTQAMNSITRLSVDQRRAIEEMAWRVENPNLFHDADAATEYAISVTKQFNIPSRAMRMLPTVQEVVYYNTKYNLDPRDYSVPHDVLYSVYRYAIDAEQSRLGGSISKGDCTD